MNAHVLRTVPLSLSTRQAWASTGAYVVPRKRIQSYFGHDVPLLVAADDIIINLGWRKSINHGHVWNKIDTVKAVSSPGALRKTMHNFLPPHPEDGKPGWIKGPGYGGNNKSKLDVVYHTDYMADDNVDTQTHINGVEYRINTVGNRVVQAHRKVGDLAKGFEYEWVGVQGISSNGIIPLIKEAIVLVPSHETSILGWDIMVGSEDGRPYVLEINTSPGVNEPTAHRIVDAVQVYYNSKSYALS